MGWQIAVASLCLPNPPRRDKKVAAGGTALSSLVVHRRISWSETGLKLHAQADDTRTVCTPNLDLAATYIQSLGPQARVTSGFSAVGSLPRALFPTRPDASLGGRSGDLPAVTEVRVSQGIECHRRGECYDPREQSSATDAQRCVGSLPILLLLRVRVRVQVQSAVRARALSPLL
jgi:hypothetical protein